MQIATIFNNFFVNIANDLANNLPPTSDNPYAYFSNHQYNQSFFEPVTIDECSKVVAALKSIKQNTNTISVSMLKKITSYSYRSYVKLLTFLLHLVYFLPVLSMPPLFQYLERAILLMSHIIDLLQSYYS